jgi:hypothetical protein
VYILEAIDNMSGESFAACLFCLLFATMLVERVFRPKQPRKLESVDNGK